MRPLTFLRIFKILANFTYFAFPRKILKKHGILHKNSCWDFYWDYSEFAD